MIQIKQRKPNEWLVNNKKVFVLDNVIINSMDLTEKEKEALKTHLKSLK
jgi:hypothetical protein